MVRSQRNLYDHAIRAVGVKIIEVGLPDRYSGAGVRDAEPWEIADAINENTACIFYVANIQSQPDLEEVTSVAHAAGIPVLVDAAAQLPPIDNLTCFITKGADLVAFSGGKAIGGPQGSGILCGRKELVAAAVLQNLDQDIFFDQWIPPSGLLDKSKLRGLPQHGIGRSCKVGKEQVVGLLIALQKFIQNPTRIEKQEELLNELKQRLIPKIQVQTQLVYESGTGEPKLHLNLFEQSRDAAFKVLLDLQNGNPGIHSDPSKIDMGLLIFRASCLKPHHPKQIAERLNILLTK